MTLLLETPVELSTPEPGYDIEITPELVDDEVVYMAEHPDLPGCVSHGSTPEEARESLADAREMYLAALESSGLAAPEPKRSPQVIVTTLHVPEPSLASEKGPVWTVRLGHGMEMQVQGSRLSGRRS